MFNALRSKLMLISVFLTSRALPRPIALIADLVQGQVELGQRRVDLEGLAEAHRARITELLVAEVKLGQVNPKPDQRQPRQRIQEQEQEQVRTRAILHLAGELRVDGQPARNSPLQLRERAEHRAARLVRRRSLDATALRSLAHASGKLVDELRLFTHFTDIYVHGGTKLDLDRNGKHGRQSLASHRFL
jgi:hypothetical protein